MTDLATDLRDCADNVDDEYPGAASVMRRAADHLASSGPAGENAINVLESLKAKDDLIRKLETQVGQANERINNTLFGIGSATEGWGNKTIGELRAIGLTVITERDTARQECEAQKARAIRAEGALKKYGKHQLECHISTGFVDPRMCSCGLREALTPAPDHAKGEQQ